MDKQELVNRIYQQCGEVPVRKKDINSVITIAINTIADALVNKETIRFNNLGRFIVKPRKWKMVDKGNRFNPFDNKTITGTTNLAYFRVTSGLKKRMNS